MQARWIIEAKFDQPRQHRRQIERAHIVRQLSAHDDGLITVQAPAGFGKSTLLGQWARDMQKDGAAVAWLNLDEDDREVEQFAAYLIAALQRCLGEERHAEADSSIYAGLSPKAALAAFLSEISRLQRPLALVLDDYHRAESEAVDALMRGFIERAVPMIRIAIASRSLPRLGLSRLKAESRLLLITDRDLRFNDGETSLFFASELPADKQEWSRFATLAEGWPVALQFARMWLGEGGDLAALSAASEVHDLGAYLSEQVFATLSGEQQAFLLRTSPFELVSTALAEAVGIEKADGLVRALARSALPITVLSPEPIRFRYHHLLRDFLLARASSEGIDLAEIHRRAARWFAQSGDLASAVRHALSGDDAAYAATILENAGGWRLVYHGQGHLRAILRSVHQALPPVEGRFPRLLLGASIMAAKSGNLVVATELFHRIVDGPPRDTAFADEVAIIDALIRLYCDQPLGEAALDALVALTGRIDGADAVGLALATNLVAYFMLQKGDYLKARRFGERAIQHFRRGEAVFGEIHLYAHIGAAELAMGNRHTARTTYRTMRDLGRRVLGEDSELEAIASVLEAETAYEMDERAEARLLLVDALSRIEQADGWFDVFSAGYMTAARLDLADHGPAAAFAALDRGRVTAAARSMTRLSRLIEEEAVRTATIAGDLDRAFALARGLGLSSVAAASAGEIAMPVSAVRGEGPALIMARLAILSGSARDAITFIEVAEEQIQRFGAPLTRRITARLLRGLAEQALGRPDRALAAVATATRLAAGEGFTRILLDEGEACCDLIAELGALGSTEPALRMRIDQLLNRAGPSVPAFGAPDIADPGSADTGLADPALSTREHQVLSLLAEGLSNKEIARAIGVDPNTVKYHLKRLFSKLAVERRGRAVIRARQFGLID